MADAPRVRLGQQPEQRGLVFLTGRTYGSAQLVEQPRKLHTNP